MKLALALIAAFAVAGCATYEETLTNSRGQTVTCKASGKNGIITGQYLRESFDNCVNQAKAAGLYGNPREACTVRRTHSRYTRPSRLEIPRAAMRWLDGVGSPRPAAG
jgi:hypothetical protein